jgi:hypothetical protein
MELGGVMVPSQMQTQYWQDIKGGKNATQAATEAVAKRNNYLLQVAIGADTPQAWSRAIEQEYDNGYLSQNDYHMLHQNFGARATVLRALQPGVTAQQDTDQLQRGFVPSPHGYVFSPRMHAGAGAEAQGGHTDPNTGLWVPDMSTPTQRAIQSGQPTETNPTGGAPGGGGGTPSPAVAAVTTVAPGPFADYAGVVHTHEGSSPTMGDFGWSPKTKVEQARKWVPQEVAGLTDQQIVAKQLSPQAEARMLQGFTADNSVTLQNAGIRPSAANLFMSHYIGPQGMINLNKVPPNMTMAEMERRGLLAPGTVANNPELQGNTTTGGFIDWAQRRAGNNTITPDNIDGRSADVGPGPGGTPGTPRPAAAPSGDAGGGVHGKPELGAGAAVSLPVQAEFVRSESKAATDAQSAGVLASRQTPTILDLRHRLSNIAPGSGDVWRDNLQRYAETYMPDKAQKFVTWLTGHKLDTAADRDAARKEFLNLALAQEAAMPGVRSGIGLSEMMTHASPNPNMPEKAISDLLNAMLIRNQAIKDYGSGLYQQVMPSASAWIDDNIKNPYHPKEAAWQEQWNENGVHAPTIYQAATDMMNGATFQTMSERYGKLSPEQQKEIGNIIRRADPSFVPANNQLH